MKVATIQEIKDAFVYNAAAFKCDKQHPSRSELQDVMRKMEENAMTVACFQNQCGEFGYATLICKESEWRQYHADRLTEINIATAVAAILALDPPGDPTNAVWINVLPADAAVPALPEFVNPGQFIIDPMITDRLRALNKLTYDQDAATYLLTSNLDKALVMLFKEIFNESI